MGNSGEAAHGPSAHSEPAGRARRSGAGWSSHLAGLWLSWAYSIRLDASDRKLNFVHLSDIRDFNHNGSGVKVMHFSRPVLITLKAFHSQSPALFIAPASRADQGEAPRHRQFAG